MIRAIKKVLVRYQRNQAQKHRKTDNRKQLKLIYAGLTERGF